MPERLSAEKRHTLAQLEIAALRAQVATLVEERDDARDLYTETEEKFGAAITRAFAAETRVAALLALLGEARRSVVFENTHNSPPGCRDDLLSHVDAALAPQEDAPDA